MKIILVITLLLASAPSLSQKQDSVRSETNPRSDTSKEALQTQRGSTDAASNPWNTTQPSPDRALAEDVKARAKSGEQSPLNPSCAGKTGEECVRGTEPTGRLEGVLTRSGLCFFKVKGETVATIR